MTSFTTQLAARKAAEASANTPTLSDKVVPDNQAVNAGTTDQVRDAAKLPSDASQDALKALVGVANEQSPTKPAENAFVGSEIQTGVEGTQPLIAQINKAVTPLEPLPVGQTKYEEGKYPEGSYRSLRAKRLTKANGAVIWPDKNGVFVPKDDEEAFILKELHELNNGQVEPL